MYKKIFYISALVFTLNGMVSADEAGDGGYTASMNEATPAASSGYATNTSSGNSSFISGIYVGGQLGLANHHYKGSQYTAANSSYVDDYKFAGRAYLGYSFSQFIAAEFGYDYYGRPKFKSSNGNTQEILQQGLDLMAKATLPLDYGFALYIKGGLAWVSRSALNGNAGTFADKPSNSKFPPLGAAGINYWFAPNMAFDLCYTKTMGVSDLPTSDIFTLGLVYRINI